MTERKLNHAGGLPSVKGTQPMAAVPPVWNRSNALRSGGPLPDFSSTRILGVDDDSNALAGFLGEVVSAQRLAADAISLSDGVTVALATITLTPGDWELTGIVAFDSSNVTMGGCVGGYSFEDITHFGEVDFTYAFAPPNLVNVSGPISVITPTFRKKIAAATTLDIVLTTVSGIIGGTADAYGMISARRMR